MTVKKLIKKLSTFDSDSQILVRFMHGDAHSSYRKDLKIFPWKDLEDK